MCKVTQPITYSSSGDTPETISQIKAHNRAWTAVCGDYDDQPTQ
jgi:hypothetical protein